jgi:pimeloyl-ACP methyl ester carboxylesterase
MAATAPIRTGFATSDEGIKLFWRAVGEGPPLVCCNGVGVSTFFWKYVVEHFSDRFQVIVWDYRGHGRSDRPAGPDDWDLSIATSARDLGAVLEDIGAGPAVLVGHSMGCQVIFERYSQDPASVLAMVPMLGSAGRVLDTFYDDPRSVHVIRLANRIARKLGPGVNALLRPALEHPIAYDVARYGRLVDPYYTLREDLLPYTRHLASIDIRLFLAMVLEAHAHDAFPKLTTIEVPTLIVAAERDTFTPLRLSYRMRELIPDAEILVLADGSHAALIEQPETINHRLDRFFADALDLKPPRAAAK